MIEMALGLLVYYLLVTDCCMSFRIPVDHTYSPVNQSLFVEINKGTDNGLREVRVHSELGPVPVT